MLADYLYNIDYQITILPFTVLSQELPHLFVSLEFVILEMDTDSDNDTQKLIDVTTKPVKLAIQGITLDITPVSVII